MTSTNSPNWLPEEREIRHKKWVGFRKKYATELGFDGEPDYHPQFFGTQLVEQAPPFQDMNNWHLFIPNNCVSRVKKATDTYDMIKDIAQETAKNALGEIEPTPLDLYFVAQLIIGRLTGGDDFRVQNVHSGQYESYEEHEYAGNDVPEDMIVVVTSVNTHNREDCYIYEVEDAPERFGSVLYSQTQAAHLIDTADIDPDYRVDDVAFTLHDYVREAESVSGVSAPQQPISIISSDAHSRTSYCTIDSPQAVFGEDWGDVDAMNTHLTDKGIEWKSIGAVGFWVSTGINW